MPIADHLGQNAERGTSAIERKLFLCSRMAPLGDPDLRHEVASQFPGKVLVAQFDDAEARAPCLRELVACDGAIVISDGTRGVGIDRLTSSIFELELMVIATLGMAVHVIDAVGLTRDPLDEGDLIRRMLRSDLFTGSRGLTWQHVAPTAASVLAAIRRVVCERDSVGGHMAVSRGWTWLFKQRLDRHFVDEGSIFSFPFGETPLAKARGGGFDDDALESLLARIHNVRDQSPLVKLALSWDLLRGLSERPWRVAHRRFRDAELWTGALSAWGTATAWLGQHGHTPLAQLPASTVMLKIAQEVNDLHPSSSHLLPMHGAHGAIGSCYLSLAKRSGDFIARRRMRLRGLDHVNQGLKECRDSVQRAGLHSVRGALRLSMLHIAGLDDLREAERLHYLAGGESVGLAHARVQVAKAYGFLYKTTRFESHYRVALERLQLAQKRMEQEQAEAPHSDLGQYLMCLNSLAALLRSAHQYDRAAEVEAQISQIARERGYIGQLRDIKELPEHDGKHDH